MSVITADTQNADNYLVFNRRHTMEMKENCCGLEEVAGGAFGTVMCRECGLWWLHEFVPRVCTECGNILTDTPGRGMEDTVRIMEIANMSSEILQRRHCDLRLPSVWSLAKCPRCKKPLDDISQSRKHTFAALRRRLKSSVGGKL